MGPLWKMALGCTFFLWVGNVIGAAMSMELGWRDGWHWERIWLGFYYEAAGMWTLVLVRALGMRGP